MDKKISPPVFLLALSVVVASAIFFVVYRHGYFFTSGFYVRVVSPLFVLICIIGLLRSRKKSGSH